VASLAGRRRWFAWPHMSLALVPGQTAQTVTPSGAPATVNGVLQPPPDIKSIVDKTAQFVARNGPEFEQRILCAMLNPQSCPQPQTPALTPPRTRCPHVRHSTHSQP
jgi:hypothetical protein|tara:strand:- start:114 stop:434 length:321 start_codon:yes stop_codon:yes gene_type:complete